MAAQGRKIWWGDFKAPDFAEIDPEETVAVLPVAAVEQHVDWMKIVDFAGSSPHAR